MDKLRLGYPQGVLLLPVNNLAADISQRFKQCACSGALRVALIAQAENLLPNSSSILIYAALDVITCFHLHQFYSAMVATICSWAAYVAGPLVVLMHELGLRYPQGISLLLSSAVPEGKGVSSSAAVEVAVMQALCAAHDVHIDGRHLALLCQKVTASRLGGHSGACIAVCGHQESMLCHHSKLDELLQMFLRHTASAHTMSAACLVCALVESAYHDDSLHTCQLACHCICQSACPCTTCQH